jgi:hypothetical protein
MKTLLFENTSGIKNTFQTVRRGQKHTLIDENVRLMSTTGRLIGHGYIDSILVSRFCDLTKGDIAYEHIKKCRTLSELHAELCKHYDCFEADEYVSVLTISVTARVRWWHFFFPFVYSLFAKKKRSH